MTEEEYKVLDELYFIISFDELVDQSEVPTERLSPMLSDFYKKGWIRCFDGNGNELQLSAEEVKHSAVLYRFLISKDGLFAHHEKS